MQVYGRGELTFDERLAVEREYVENLSLARDVRIVLDDAAGRVRPARRVLASSGLRAPHGLDGQLVTDPSEQRVEPIHRQAHNRT